MYTQLSNLDNCVSYASAYVLKNDRKLYEPLLSHIEEFLSSEPVVFAGQTASEYFDGKELNKDSYVFEIYASDPLNTSERLVDSLYAKFKNNSPFIDINTLALETLIKHTEYSISVGSRSLMKVLTFGEYRGVDLIEIMNPIKAPGRFSGAIIKIVPEDWYLITAYRMLYSPQYVDQWEALYNLSGKILTTIIENNNPSKTGGENITTIARIALLSIVKKSGLLLIGDKALNLYLDSDTQTQRLQLIFDSNNSPESIVGLLSKKLEDSTKKIAMSDHKVDLVNYYLNIPSDFRIRKFTIYITHGKNKFPLVDMFNSGTYELLPYVVKEGYKIAHPFVCLRFYLIDLWILKLIEHLGGDNNQRRNQILNKMKTINELPKQFQLGDYYGEFSNENVARKKLMKALGMAPKYYPAKKSEPTKLPEPTK